MKLKWRFFSEADDLLNHIQRYDIKRENIQGIFLTHFDHYELFYWE